MLICKFYIFDKLTEMINDVLATYKEDERPAKYDSIFKYMNDEAITIPLYYPNRSTTYNTRLGELKLAPTTYQDVIWNTIKIK